MEKRLIEMVTAATFAGIENEYTEKLFNIKNNILNSIEYGFKEYNIYAVPVRREDLKIYEGYLYPMSLDYMKKSDLLNKEMFLKENGLYLEDFFVKENFENITALNNESVHGIIATDNGLFGAEFQFRINNEYFKKTEELYKITEKNKISWRSLNIPYIKKFVSVYLVKVDDEDYWNSKEIISVDYNKNFAYEQNYVLCWNIRQLEYEVSEMVKPTEERLIYEYLLDSDINRKYLMNSENGEVLASYIMNYEQIKFVTDKRADSKTVFWEILNNLDDELAKYLDYKVYSNENDNIQRKNLLSDPEQIRDVVSSLKGITDIRLIDVYTKAGNRETEEKIKFNSFLEEEFQIKGKRDKIYLDFEYKKSYLTDEITGYILSELDLQFKDFEFLALK